MHRWQSFPEFVDSSKDSSIDFRLSVGVGMTVSSREYSGVSTPVRDSASLRDDRTFLKLTRRKKFVPPSTPQAQANDAQDGFGDNAPVHL